MSTSPQDTRTRASLAFSIVTLSLLGVAAASTVAIVFATPEGRPEMARLVFASALPLLGTWVGTVLAFYFARDNFEAATDSSIRLSQSVKPETPANQIMIIKERIIPFRVQAGVDPKSVLLLELYNHMLTYKVKRLPIFVLGDSVLYVIHQSTISSFADLQSKEVRSLTENLGDLLANASLAQAIAAMGFVGPDATVLEVRMAMRSVEGCNDVFITVNGRKDGPVLGWITNTDLAGAQ